MNVAGAWGHEIAARFGERVPEDVIAPNMCVTEPVPYFMVPNFGVCGGGFYVRQIPRGNVIFGGGRGVADRERLRAYPVAATQPRFERAQTIALVPRLRHAQIIRTWTGIEGVMPDDIPVIGPSRTTPGLFHAFGFSGHGFQLGPAMGAVLERAHPGRGDADADRRLRYRPFRVLVAQQSSQRQNVFCLGQVENGAAQLLTALGADQILGEQPELRFQFRVAERILRISARVFDGCPKFPRGV